MATPLQSSCLENPHGRRSLAGYTPCGRKVLDMTERLNTDWLTVPALKSISEESSFPQMCQMNEAMTVVVLP